MTDGRHSDYATETIEVREEERFDGQPVVDFLRGKIDLPDSPLEVEQFGSGHSNLTYLLRIGAQEFVLRRPPLGALLATAHDMDREWKVLSALADTPVPSPRPIAYCEDPALIGAPFYVMERLHGFVVGRDDAPELNTPERVGAMAYGIVEALAILHDQNYEAIGLGDFGRPEGFVERQIERWRKQWISAQTRELPIMDELDAWLRENLPAKPGAGIVHGDVSPTNTMFDRDDPRRVVALLDWEMSTVGDPLCDLGYFLAMWPQPDDEGARREITPDHLRIDGIPSREELAAHYGKARGIEASNYRFYQTLALYKLAVILEGIFSRYKKGQTSDERFIDIGRRMPIIAQAAYDGRNG